MKSPYINFELLTVKYRLEKLDPPHIAAIRGVIMSLTCHNRNVYIPVFRIRDPADQDGMSPLLPGPEQLQ